MIEVAYRSALRASRAANALLPALVDHHLDIDSLAPWRRAAGLEPSRHRGRVVAHVLGDLADRPARHVECLHVHVLLLLGHHRDGSSRWLLLALSVLGSSDRLEGPLTPAGGPGQEEHGLSYDREFR